MLFVALTSAPDGPLGPDSPPSPLSPFTAFCTGADRNVSFRSTTAFRSDIFREEETGNGRQELRNFQPQASRGSWRPLRAGDWCRFDSFKVHHLRDRNQEDRCCQVVQENRKGPRVRQAQQDPGPLSLRLGPGKQASLQCPGARQALRGPAPLLVHDPPEKEKNISYTHSHASQAACTYVI
ncbi:hypothetical protein EYF80_030037 [Liparis tanakae]|uniref:Uncharacterized protein n=1 Tax=Liparis tanakae TaxID=230148 RepID=A0A4Z2H4L8_9TELE|nr:hypothetical protein EYF80_030037 [Liparis tanakae]